MSKEKTAMQMIIEEMQKDYDSINGSESYVANVQKSEIGLRILQAKHLLKKEQEQIETAFYHGRNFNNPKSSKDYYKSKYGGKDADR